MLQGKMGRNGFSEKTWFSFQDGKYISCEGIVQKSDEQNESLVLGGKTFLDIFVGNKSVIPLSGTFEPQYFGPVEFNLKIENEEKTILSETVPFSYILGEGNGGF